MIDLPHAREIAMQAILEEADESMVSEITILDHNTKETKYGWIFFYNSKTFRGSNQNI